MWNPSKPDDERFFRKPGDINRTTNRNGNLRENKIGADGKAVKDRYYSDHGNSSKHSIPHDHDISWEGNRPNWGDTQNYWDGNIPNFKPYWRCNLSYRILNSHTSLMIANLKRSVISSGVRDAAERSNSNGTVFILALSPMVKTRIFLSTDDALEYIVGSDRLRDVITQVTVLDHTI